MSDVAAPANPPGRVLVVEDDASLAEVLCGLLQIEGYVAEHAADGHTGLARLQAGDIDLLLLDLSLPGLHGLDLCRQVRATALTGEVYVPIIMLTALGRSADRVAGFAAGADDYVPKPFDADELLGRVRVWLRMRQQMKLSHGRLRAQYAALAQQGDLLELASDGIFVRDLTGKVTYWSAGAERLYGWTKAEALGKVSNELLRTQFPLPLADIEIAVLVDGCWQGELVHTRRDGSQVRVASRWSLQRTAAGHAGAILELNTDITAERALREVEQRALEARLEGVQLAAREIAHLVNNDLQPALGLLDALRDDPPRDLAPVWRALIPGAADGVTSAVRHIRRLGRVERVEVRQTPVGPSLDLDRSVGVSVDGRR